MGYHLPPVKDQLAEIYEQHRQGLYALALTVTRKPELAEDAVHDAIVRLCRTTAKPKGDPVGYVFATVRNAAIDITRYRKARPEASNRDAAVFLFQADDSPGVVEAAGRAELARHAMALVEALPDKQREVVVLRLISGLKFEQIAQTLNLPLGTVTTRYRRTMIQLREQMLQLEQTGDTPPSEE